MMWATPSSSSGIYTVSNSGGSETAGPYCPRCGYTLSNDPCTYASNLVSRWPSNYFSEDDSKPEPHRALLVDNWRALWDAALPITTLKPIRWRPEVRAPPAIC